MAAGTAERARRRRRTKSGLSGHVWPRAWRCNVRIRGPAREAKSIRLWRPWPTPLRLILGQGAVKSNQATVKIKPGRQGPKQASTRILVLAERRAQRFMSAAQVVVRDVQRDGGNVVVQLL